MKFGTLLELNSNIEWFDKYVDYDGLKKLFPNEPFDPSYHRGRPSTGRDEEEASPLLQAGDERGGASEEEFIAACDRERNKVIEFYKEKEQQLSEDFKSLQSEIKMLEDRELEDVIEEEDEDEEQEEGGNMAAEAQTNGQSGSRRFSQDNRRFSQDEEALAGLSSPPAQTATTPGFFKRFGRAAPDTKDDTDLLEAALAPAVLQQSQQTARLGSKPRSKSRSGYPASPMKNGSNAGPSPKFKRSVSDYELPSPSMGAHAARERGLSVSSASSGGGVHGYRFRGNLGLIPMDNTGLADSMISTSTAQGGGSSHAPLSYIWTASSDYGKVVRIGFKKRIAALWLEGNYLGQYTELNMTAFEKILKK
jgi:phosphate transporter